MIQPQTPVSFKGDDLDTIKFVPPPHSSDMPSFNRLLALLTNFDAHSPLTPHLLFSICNILAQDSRISYPSFLPAVLRCFTHSWRLLPLERRSPQDLALRLASLTRIGPPALVELSPASTSRDDLPLTRKNRPALSAMSATQVGYRNGCTSCRILRSNPSIPKGSNPLRTPKPDENTPPTRKTLSSRRTTQTQLDRRSTVSKSSNVVRSSSSSSSVSGSKYKHPARPALPKRNL